MPLGGGAGAGGRGGNQDEWLELAASEVGAFTAGLFAGLDLLARPLAMAAAAALPRWGSDAG